MTPDLATALALACHRDHLADRNANIPVSLPAVWATLGQFTRAEALATSITDPDRQAQALAQVAEALAEQAGRQASRAGRGRGPLHHRPGPAGASAGGGGGGAGRRPGSTSRPRPWPAPSPTRTAGAGAWRRWRRRWPGRGR